MGFVEETTFSVKFTGESFLEHKYYFHHKKGGKNLIYFPFENKTQGKKNYTKNILLIE